MIDNLYSALKRRRCGRAVTSESGSCRAADGGAPAALPASPLRSEAANAAEEVLALLVLIKVRFLSPPYSNCPGSTCLTHVGTVGPVSFDLDRRRDGEDVFACGYPLGALELTTTSGHVATSWAQHSLLTAKKYGILEESEVIRLDLRANPGSSGGPIFSSSNQSVIGLADEGSGLPGGWIAFSGPDRESTRLN